MSRHAMQNEERKEILGWIYCKEWRGGPIISKTDMLADEPNNKGAQWQYC